MDCCLLRGVLSGNLGLFALLVTRILERLGPDNCDIFCALLRRIAQWYLPLRGGGVNKSEVAHRFTHRGVNCKYLWQQGLTANRTDLTGYNNNGISISGTLLLADRSGSELKRGFGHGSDPFDRGNRREVVDRYAPARGRL